MTVHVYSQTEKRQKQTLHIYFCDQFCIDLQKAKKGRLPPPPSLISATTSQNDDINTVNVTAIELT